MKQSNSSTIAIVVVVVVVDVAVDTDAVAGVATDATAITATTAALHCTVLSCQTILSPTATDPTHLFHHYASQSSVANLKTAPKRTDALETVIQAQLRQHRRLSRSSRPGKHRQLAWPEGPDQSGQAWEGLVPDGRLGEAEMVGVDSSEKVFIAKLKDFRSSSS